MNLHPTMIAAHIAVTTNGARRHKPRRVSRAITLFIAGIAMILTYYASRMV